MPGGSTARSKAQRVREKASALSAMAAPDGLSSSIGTVGAQQNRHGIGRTGKRTQSTSDALAGHSVRERRSAFQIKSLSPIPCETKRPSDRAAASISARSIALGDDTAFASNGTAATPSTGAIRRSISCSSTNHAARPSHQQVEAKTAERPAAAEFAVAGPGQSRRPSPEGARRLRPDTLDNATDGARRQIGEAEKAKTLSARRDKFCQPLSPPFGSSLLGTAAHQGGRGVAAAQPGIQRIASRQAVIDAGQRFRGLAAQRDAIQNDIDEESESGLFAGLAERLDQPRGVPRAARLATGRV